MQPIPSFESVVSNISTAIMRNDLNKVHDLFAFAHEHFDATDEKQWKRLCTLPLDTAAMYGFLDCILYVLPLSWLDQTTPSTIKNLEKSVLNAAKKGNFIPIYAIDNHMPLSENAIEQLLVVASGIKNTQAVAYFYNRCTPENVVRRLRGKKDILFLEDYHSAEKQRQIAEKQQQLLEKAIEQSTHVQRQKSKM